MRDDGKNDQKMRPPPQGQLIDPGGTPISGGGESTLATSYFASCDSGAHRPWMGLKRTDRGDAQNDCDAHNETCDAKGAVVVSF